MSIRPPRITPRRVLLFGQCPDRAAEQHLDLARAEAERGRRRVQLAEPTARPSVEAGTGPVRYLGDSPAGAIAECLRNFTRRTPAVLQPPPAATTGSRLGLARFNYSGDVLDLDLDDPEVLTEPTLRPSAVVTRDREVTQRWARAIADTGEHAGVS